VIFALFTEQQKTLVSLSCHIIIGLNDCWSCMACCRCYQLGYQISAAALYNVLNRGPVQCNVEAAHVITMFMCLLIYLPPPHPSTFCILLGCYDLLHSHCCWTECTSAESTNYLVDLTNAYMYMYILFTLIQLWLVTEKPGSMTSTVLQLNPRYIEACYNEGPVYVSPIMVNVVTL